MSQVYIYQQLDWPNFTWKQELLAARVSELRHRQGRLLGAMESMSLAVQTAANLRTLTLDIVKSSKIEDIILDPDPVSRSLAHKLGIRNDPSIPEDAELDGMTGMIVESTGHYNEPLTDQRLFAWHDGLFPTGYSGSNKILVGNYRDNKVIDPMQVKSNVLGRETIHFRAPNSYVVPREMSRMLEWFNQDQGIDPVLKAAVAHLWFLTIHPFDDGSGRMARALTDLQLARADKTSKRFYSLSAQILEERQLYYEMLERTQKGKMDITPWLAWFLDCLERALVKGMDKLNGSLQQERFWQRHSTTPLNERQRAILQRLLDGFDERLTSSLWAKLASTSQDTAARDLNDLMEKNILRKNAAGGRSTHYKLKTND